MSWSEIKKAVNSDLTMPLNEQINRLTDLDTSIKRQSDLTLTNLDIIKKEMEHNEILQAYRRSEAKISNTYTEGQLGIYGSLLYTNYNTLGGWLPDNYGVTYSAGSAFQRQGGYNRVISGDFSTMFNTFQTSTTEYSRSSIGGKVVLNDRINTATLKGLDSNTEILGCDLSRNGEVLAIIRATIPRVQIFKKSAPESYIYNSIYSDTISAAAPTSIQVSGDGTKVFVTFSVEPYVQIIEIGDNECIVLKGADRGIDGFSKSDYLIGCKVNYDGTVLLTKNKDGNAHRVYRILSGSNFTKFNLKVGKNPSPLKCTLNMSKDGNKIIVTSDILTYSDSAFSLFKLFYFNEATQTYEGTAQDRYQFNNGRMGMDYPIYPYSDKQGNNSVFSAICLSSDGKWLYKATLLYSNSSSLYKISLYIHAFDISKNILSTGIPIYVHEISNTKQDDLRYNYLMAFELDETNRFMQYTLSGAKNSSNGFQSSYAGALLHLR